MRLDYQEPFIVHGAHTISEENLEAAAQQYYKLIMNSIYPDLEDN